MKTIYTASLDKLTKTITFCVPLIFIGAIFIPLIIHIDDPSFNSFKHWISIIVGILVLIVCGVVYLYRVLRYELNETELIIVRPINSLHIPLNSIKGIIKLTREDMFPGTIRTFGNGGFFGYTGYFWNRAFGTMIFYLTQRKNLILIETLPKEGKKKGTKSVISPDDIGMEGKLIELLKGMKR